MGPPIGRWSIGTIMWLIVLIALQLVLFQGIWWIILIPPMTIGLLTINIGVIFGLARPRSWEARIIGMLVGGVAAVFVSGFYFLWEFRGGPPGVLGVYVRNQFERWAAYQADPVGEIALALRFIGHHTLEIEAILLDVLGIALIWFGGNLDRVVRRQWAKWPDVTSPTSTHRAGPVRAS